MIIIDDLSTQSHDTIKNVFNSGRRYNVTQYLYIQEFQFIDTSIRFNFNFITQNNKRLLIILQRKIQRKIENKYFHRDLSRMCSMFLKKMI